MTSAPFTTQDFLTAIHRELQKREKTYPKLIAKAVKANEDPADLQQILDNQNNHLKFVYHSLLETPNIPRTDKHDVYRELDRELQMRKKYYPRFVNYFKSMTQETADYELAVWQALIIHFNQTF